MRCGMPVQRLQNPFDLLGAFFVLPTEVGGERFGMRSNDLIVVVADEFADDGNLIGKAVGPGRGF